MINVWTEDLVLSLLAQWESGNSIRTIASNLCDISPSIITNDMVSGKINRLKRKGIILSSRPSPIKPRPKNAVQYSHSGETCSFIDGDPRKDKQCGKVAVRGKPYCLKHCLICYPKMRHSIANGQLVK